MEVKGGAYCARTSNSAPPLAPTSRQQTVLVCPASEMVEPESGFHSRIEPSSLPVMRNSHIEETRRQEISDDSCGIARLRGLEGVSIGQRTELWRCEDVKSSVEEWGCSYNISLVSSVG